MENSTFEKEYASITSDLMEYIGRMKNEIENYASQNKAQQWVIDKNEKKLNELYTIKTRFDNLVQNMLLTRDAVFNTGKQFGYRQAQKEFDNKFNPYDRFINPEEFRQASIQKAIHTWPELF